MAIKINTIQFYGYRGFYDGSHDKYLITTENKNLLVYGENGSGKTSLYRGVKDFFYSSVGVVDFVKHSCSSELNEGFVKIRFNDGTEETYSEDGQEVPTKDYIKTATYLNGFLSYKELLKTYLAEEDENEIKFV